ncbi:hypothetical protein [Nocardia bovistercoris]|uniref:Uncharacterized protein n=1 Tax=Nocardia bovistercoris TaxID=2785916 RepID=A0A931N6X1_9NOCA|nr:hypothetical protein [Nocardia bovistercoris]MBH0781177.1 hypothetical protein [Nocardia bovistercoris]
MSDDVFEDGSLVLERRGDEYVLRFAGGSALPTRIPVLGPDGELLTVYSTPHVTLSSEPASDSRTAV